MTFKFKNRRPNSAAVKFPAIKHVNCIISRTEAKATKIRMKIQKSNKLLVAEEKDQISKLITLMALRSKKSK